MAAIEPSERAQARLDADHPLASRIYGLAPYLERAALKETGVTLYDRVRRAHADYERQRRLIDLQKSATVRFSAGEKLLAEALRPLQDEIEWRGWQTHS